MPEQENQVEHWTSQTLFQRILAACREGSRGIVEFEQLPNSIELGAVQPRAEQLRSHTAETGLEAGLAITFDPVTGKLLIDREYTEGVVMDGVQGAAPINVSYSLTQQAEALMRSQNDPREVERLFNLIEVLNQEPVPAERLFSDHPDMQTLRSFIRRPIGTMHSHPNEVPFSVGDIALFLNQTQTDHIGFHVLARPGGITEALIMTPNTVGLNAEASQGKYRQWDKAIDDRMMQVVGPRHTPERAEIFTRVNEAMTKTLAKKYMFGWYQSTSEHPERLQRV